MSADLVAALLFVASDLDARGYPLAGAVRQGARRLSELEALAPAPDACEQCGGPVHRKRLGRPRRYCSECSPEKNRKMRKQESVTFRKENRGN